MRTPAPELIARFTAPPSDEQRKAARQRHLLKLLGEDRLLRLAARCPGCSAPPKLRVPEWLVGAMKGVDPDRLWETVECHRRGCAEVYPILVRHVQLAG